MLRTAGNQRNGNAAQFSGMGSLLWVPEWVLVDPVIRSYPLTGRKYAWLGQSFWPALWLQMGAKTSEKFECALVSVRNWKIPTSNLEYTYYISLVNPCPSKKKDRVQRSR